MEEFIKLFNALDENSKRAFRNRWGFEPWRESMNPALRRMWLRQLQLPRQSPRWDPLIKEHRQDALLMALRGKNRHAAIQLLERRKSFTSIEAGRYALLCLGWAPDLLKQVLSRYSGPPLLYLEHRITWPSPSPPLPSLWAGQASGTGGAGHGSGTVPES